MKKIVSSLLLCVAMIGMANASDKESLQKEVLSYQAIKADFAQTVTKNDGSVLSNSAGYLALKRPDHLMMHTLEPDEQVLFTKGNVVVFYDPFVEQASLYDKKDLYSSPFLLLTSNDEKIWGQYEISKSTKGYKIVPKNNQELKSIELELNGKNIKAIVICMADGNTNRYDLKNITNSVADSVFDYTIPDGTQLDDERRSN
jgi:outer membrane lipoprotein carrier protein